MEIFTQTQSYKDVTIVTCVTRYCVSNSSAYGYRGLVLAYYGDSVLARLEAQNICSNPKSAHENALSLAATYCGDTSNFEVFKRK